MERVQQHAIYFAIHSAKTHKLYTIQGHGNKQEKQLQLQCKNEQFRAMLNKSIAWDSQAQLCLRS